MCDVSRACTRIYAHTTHTQHAQDTQTHTHAQDTMTHTHAHNNNTHILYTTLRFLWQHIHVLGTGMLLLVVVKSTLIALVVRAYGPSWRTAWAVGVSECSVVRLCVCVCACVCVCVCVCVCAALLSCCGKTCPLPWLCVGMDSMGSGGE